MRPGSVEAHTLILVGWTPPHGRDEVLPAQVGAMETRAHAHALANHALPLTAAPWRTTLLRSSLGYIPRARAWAVRARTAVGRGAYGG